MANYNDVLREIETFRQDNNTTDRVQLMKVNEFLNIVYNSVLYHFIKNEPEFLYKANSYPDEYIKQLWDLEALYLFFDTIEMNMILKETMKQIDKILSN